MSNQPETNARDLEALRWHLTDAQDRLVQSKQEHDEAIARLHARIAALIDALLSS